MTAETMSNQNTKDLLRFITCGNVDDGKSTLIGRLLLESGAIYDDQIEVLQAESAKHGTAGSHLDTALLLDGLEDERQQGITIDVAYRYFTSATRKFIIADTPGHEQFTRNMATGASTADLAILLIDATKGVSTQTRRHAFIVSLLGIQQVVLAVNKMDLVDFDQETFEEIQADFAKFALDLDIQTIWAIPLSALDGDNIVQPSQRADWYDGPTLMKQLNDAPVTNTQSNNSLRFPVQWVNRPDASFRGFSGTILSGNLRVGDDITVLPSQKKSRVERIVTMAGDLDEAAATDAVTVTLADEIDVSRGDMFVNDKAPPAVSTRVDATILWMSETALVPGRQYWLKQTTRRTSCEIQTIHYGVDVNTLSRTTASSLSLNEIGCCRILLRDPLAFDSYHENRATGSFIVVDRINHETVAAGMLTVVKPEIPAAGNWDAASSVVRPQLAKSLVSADQRAQRYGNKPRTILISGLSGSGKTSIATALEKRLFESNRIAIVLDGQTMRLGISRDLGFTAEERSENLRRASEIAKLINDSGQICIAAFVAPSDWVRIKARQLIGEERFLHVHLCTSAEVCRQRDQTGQYQAADSGEITSFPGVTFEYESPNQADLVFDTSVTSINEAVKEILKKI
ncbi:Bifunctional enzyme CysN/CysC [Roseimaritima multifibrata]|uniref:Sulfate adenylyltransferase subunit 1 n=1 Tax=Roseimaritima multifibrata TaxID=1930274 RepID=A0A517M9E7_9BACT|nr:sulfate adenylyltransferase subunit CysN [Roseimaritima multifibrata]QDS91518.1 Bifunctional enzyme CysN/CysC [Roseimaritima multifibrata]